MYLTLLIFSPLVGIILLACMRNSEMKIVKVIGMMSTLLPLGLTMALYALYVGGTPLREFAVQKEWIKFGDFPFLQGRPFAIEYELGISGLSLAMLLLTSLLALLAAIRSFSIQEGARGYYILFLLLEVGMLGVFAAENLLLFFIFFEITLIPMFFLIGKWGGFNSEKAAYQFLIYNGVGSAILLIVFTVLFAKIGTTNFGLLQHALSTTEVLDATTRYGLLISLIVAFGVKLPIFPLHRWMVSVHVEAPIGVVMLHAGVLLKIGAYGLVRMGAGLFPEEFTQLAPMLAILGVVNLLYGAYLALIQTNFRKMLAYSSISHMGIVLIGMGAVNDIGMQGAIFQVVSHGLIAAFLFFLVGMMEENVKTMDITRLGGLASSMPILSGFLLTGAMASLGLPGMSGFVSEFMAFTGLFSSKPIIAAIGTLGIILTAAYLLRATLGVTFGERGTYPEVKELPIMQYVPVMILLVCIIGIGVFPSVLASLVQPTIEAIMLGIGG
ncbi:complex I subunit 4 family protein [Priestia taiwanensis]|nr:NADH-quinone oxidoreductase subunit M [Priestia taiwanensis]